MTNFPGTFCTPKPDPGANFRKNWAIMKMDPCEKPDLVLLQNVKPF